MNEATLSDWRILLLDDDEEEYILARSLLRDSRTRKIGLDWTASFEEGQKLLFSGKYDAVLVDYDMGMHTGIEFIREGVKAGCPIPLLLYTGRGGYEVDLEAMQAGATLYLSKSEATPLLLERSLRYAIERKQIENRLAITLQEHTDLLTSIQDGFFSISRDWKISYINERAARNAGLTPEELIGQNIWEKFPKMLGTNIETYYRQAMDERKSGQFEMPGNYTFSWYTLSVYPSPQGVSVYWQDITARKQTEQALLMRNAELEAAHAALAEEKLRLEAVMQALPVGVAIIDEKGGRVLANQTYEGVWGGNPPAVQSVKDYKPYQAWWPETGKPVEDEEWASAVVLETGQAVTGQVMEIQRFDGKRALVVNSAAPLYDTQGNIIGNAVAIQDITHIREIEKALNASEEKYRTLFDAMSEGAAFLQIVYDAHGQAVDYIFLDLNVAYERILGAKREERVGHKATEFYAQPFYLEVMAQVAKTGQPVTFEATIQNLRKKLRAYVFSSAPDIVAGLFTEIEPCA